MTPDTGKHGAGNIIDRASSSLQICDQKPAVTMAMILPFSLVIGKAEETSVVQSLLLCVDAADQDKASQDFPIRQAPIPNAEYHAMSAVNTNTHAE